MIEYSEETWDKSDCRFIDTFPYIEISRVGLGTNEYAALETPVAEAPSRARQVVRTGDILISLTRPHRGAVASVLPEHDGTVASTGFAVVRNVDSRQIHREFLLICLTASFGCNQMLMRSSGGNYPAVTRDEVSQILIPSIPLDTQSALIKAMGAARAERKAKLVEADALLAGIDDFVSKVIGIPGQFSPRRSFALRAKDLVDAINPVRYQSRQIEQHLPFSNTVGAVGYLVENKLSPAKDAPDEQFDWIRIDDLPNQPWQVETIRTAMGGEITGALFEVQENDILIARLGPTILNAKFVVCPELSRRTVASGEFLVLRCTQDYQPEAVLWVLRTASYREMMYMRTRGATPSRFRLNGNDLTSIPFPEIDDALQSVIAEEVHTRREQAHRLRAEAEAGWEAAKRWFEVRLLGER